MFDSNNNLGYVYRINDNSSIFSAESYAINNAF